MSQSVVGPLHGPRTTERDAVSVLRDRVLLMATNPSPGLLATVDPRTGGIVLSGTTAAAMARPVSRAFSNLPILIDPASARDYVATAEHPFQIEADGMIPQTLGGLLQGQRDAGATLVITPSGQITAGDSAALKALLYEANTIAGQDVLTLVVVEDVWLTPPWIDQLCAVLKTSKHPVLLGVINGNDDPLQRKGAVAGYRRVAREVPHVVAWRTDLSGLGAMVYGAIAAVIGRVPSQRRYAGAGTTPYSSNKADRTPHVLLTELLRYSRAQYMQIEWFAQGESLPCFCPHCHGLGLERFDGSAASVAVADQHNAFALRELVASMLDADHRPTWWIDRLRDAEAEHAALGGRLGMEIALPKYIERWLGEAD